MKTDCYYFNGRKEGSCSAVLDHQCQLKEDELPRDCETKKTFEKEWDKIEAQRKKGEE